MEVKEGDKFGADRQLIIQTGEQIQILRGGTGPASNFYSHFSNHKVLLCRQTLEGVDSIKNTRLLKDLSFVNGEALSKNRTERT